MLRRIKRSGCESVGLGNQCSMVVVDLPGKGHSLFEGPVVEAKVMTVNRVPYMFDAWPAISGPTCISRMQTSCSGLRCETSRYDDCVLRFVRTMDTAKTEKKTSRR